MPKSKLTPEQRYQNQLEASRKWKARNKEHVSEYNKEWSAKNPEIKKELKRLWDCKNTEHKKAYSFKWKENNPLYFKEKHLKAEYGLTLADYAQMLEDQDHKCKCCGIGKEEAPSQRLVVDHCHSTGKVRGLLCSHCNVALGMVKDSKETLRNLINYLGD